MKQKSQQKRANTLVIFHSYGFCNKLAKQYSDRVYDNRRRRMWHRDAISGMDGMSWYPGGVRYEAPYNSLVKNCKTNLFFIKEEKMGRRPPNQNYFFKFFFFLFV